MIPKRKNKKMAYDASLDETLRTFDICLNEAGKATSYGPNVAKPVEGETRYRFAVVSRNGGAPKLRRQIVRFLKSGDERVRACSSIPLAHAETLGKVGGVVAAQALAVANTA